MQLTITGKNIGVGDALKHHIEQALNSISEKYFSNPLEATVIVSKESNHFRADLSVHIGKGIILRVHSSNDDPYLCVDDAMDKIGKRLRRHKNRLRDHHKPETAQMDEELTLQQFIVSSEEGSESETNGNPVVIAEVSTRILPLTVSEAIMHLDLTEQPVILFQNKSNRQLNVLYRRLDGNISWVDPSLLQN